MRRTPLPLGLALLAGACLIDGALAEPGPTAAAPRAEVQGATPSPVRSDPARLAAAQARLAGSLIARLAGAEAPASLTVSPGSLAAVFATLDLGASPKMRAAIARTLGFEGRARGSDLAGLRALPAVEGGPLTLANAIVFDPQSKPKPEALAKLKAVGAEALVMSLAEAGALERINAWVSERTKGLIPALLDRLPGHPGLVALNALHFKDRWQAPFDPASTRSEPFHTADGREVETPMMHLASGVRRFRQDDRFVAAELPFATARYALVVVTTREGAARPSALGAAADWLGGEGFAEAPGTVALPRFKLSGSADLLDVLDRMGLSPARNAGDALAGLAAGPQTIARVVQKTEIRVDEEGAEAAAATAVTTSRSLTAGGTVRLVADRPFLFALRDRETGLIPVAGYVGEPTEATVAAK